jgi:hypothetical protein
VSEDRLVVDLDDFEDGVSSWGFKLLDALHAESGKRFKATLFTIPGKTSRETLETCRRRCDWLELAVHGWEHDGPECLSWDADRTRRVLDYIESMEEGAYVRVFKAPHWSASPAVYHVLGERKWGIADHPRNALCIPRACKRYVLGDNHSLGIGVPHPVLPLIQAHGHFPDVEGNGIRKHIDTFRALATTGLDYAWVSEVLI